MQHISKVDFKKPDSKGDRPAYVKGVRGGDKGQVIKRNYEQGIF